MLEGDVKIQWRVEQDLQDKIFGFKAGQGNSRQGRARSGGVKPELQFHILMRGREESRQFTSLRKKRKGRAESVPQW